VTGQDSDRPALIGRSHELGVLAEALRSTRRKRPAVVHLVGQPGLGKTRLMADTCERAQRAGMLVLHGTADERTSGQLFAPLADCLDSFVSGLSPAQVARLTGIDTGDLAPLLAVPDRRALPGEDPGARRIRDLLRRLLTNLAAHRPVLLAVDDMHWADEGSIDVLADLSHRPPHAAVMLLLCYRPMSGFNPLQAVRPGRVQGAAPGVLHRLELHDLTEEDLVALLPDAGPARRRALFEACGGNPFYLQSLHRSSTALHPAAQPAGLLPPAVHAVLVAELDALSVGVRRVVDVAAVIGEPFDPTLVAEVADLTSPEVLTALDDLHSRGLCSPSGPGASWRFRHPLLRRVAYDAQPAAARMHAHRAAARSLAVRGAPLPERARHVGVSAETGDRTAARLLLAAADELSGHAPATAEQWYAAALAIVPDGGLGDSRVVQLARARTLLAVGRLGDARTIVHRALADLPADDPQRLSATGVAAHVEQLLGRNEESAALLIRELTETHDWQPGTTASLYLELATTRLMSGSFEGARAAAEQAQSVVPPGDQVLTATAAAVIALSSSANGDLSLSLEQRRRAALTVDGLTDVELARRLEAGVWLGWAEMFLERAADAERHLSRCLAIARRGAHQHLLTHLLIGYGSVLKTMGRLVAAAEAYDEAAEVAEMTGSSHLSTMVGAMQCRAATWLGDLHRAERLGARALESAAGRPDWFAAVAAAVLAQARVARGRARGCVDAILVAGGGPDLPRFDPVSRCDWWEVTVRAAIQEGHLGLARDLASRAAVTAAALPLQAPQGFAALADAQILQAEHAAGSAVNRARDAAEHFARSGYRIDRARADFVCGEALSALGNRSAAVATLAVAESEFATCGAEHLRAQVRASLRRLGRRVAVGTGGSAPAERPAQGRAGGSGAGAGEAPVAESAFGVTAEPGPLSVLSRREREVATLVAAGRTNRQIAAELVLSEKTVESHLAHIFTKLGVSSRAVVAALAARHQPQA
jgi:DNA-binding CsgD family transcriptional regulator/tetratricopeptide (TPR) repeat protein